MDYKKNGAGESLNAINPILLSTEFIIPGKIWSYDLLWSWTSHSEQYDATLLYVPGNFRS